MWDNIIIHVNLDGEYNDDEIIKLNTKLKADTEEKFITTRAKENYAQFNQVMKAIEYFSTIYQIPKACVIKAFEDSHSNFEEFKINIMHHIIFS